MGGPSQRWGSRVPAESGASGGEGPARDTADAVALAQALFLRLKDWCTSHGAQLFVLTTGYQRWHPAHPELFGISVHPANVAFLQQAEAFFEREEIPFKDLAPEIMAAWGGRLQDLLIPGDGHPNEVGSKLIAVHAWKWLRPRLREMNRQ
jgi:lysophospholipase L1-like esterase